jgi:hypothetical protein
MQKLKNMLKRSVGVILFAFIPGMAAGAPTVGWLMGGITGVLTVFSSILIYFGVQLAWDADISDADIEKGFRAAVAKQAADNKDVAEAVKVAGTPEDAFADFDFGDLGDLFDGSEHPGGEPEIHPDDLAAHDAELAAEEAELAEPAAEVTPTPAAPVAPVTYYTDPTKLP